MNLIDGEQATYPSIKEALEHCGGISRIYMWQLRDANGNSKLGVNVNEEISKKLNRNGIGYWPALQLGQWETVRIYLKDYPIGQIIESLNEFTPESDQILSDAASCQLKLQAVRDAVGAC